MNITKKQILATATFLSGLFLIPAIHCKDAIGIIVVGIVTLVLLFWTLDTLN